MREGKTVLQSQIHPAGAKNEIVPSGAEGRGSTAPCEGIVLKENLLLYVNGDLHSVACHIFTLPMKKPEFYPCSLI